MVSEKLKFYWNLIKSVHCNMVDDFYGFQYLHVQIWKQICSLTVNVMCHTVIHDFIMNSRYYGDI